MEGENVDGEIYRCDIKRFFGWDISKEKVEEIYESLMEMKSVIYKKH